MKRLPVKFTLQFCTVSKEWKSCIDLINFQKTYGVRSNNDCCMILSLWNPSIKRSINILVPAFNSQPKSDKILLGFGVRPDTLDPTIIKVSYPHGRHGSWYVSVFTLSSMDWKKLDNDCLPRESIRFKHSSQVVVGQLIFWAGHESWAVLVDVTSVTSFTLLFAIPTPNYVKLLGFTNDEISLPIVEVPGLHQLANYAKVAGTLVRQVSYECGGCYQYIFV
ncbi:hypothetical protein Tco_0996117 [Tanacetum coccineum]